MSDERAEALAAVDHVTALVVSVPELRAACERINIDVAEAVGMMIARGVDPHTAACVIGGQVTGAVLLAVAHAGATAMSAEEQP
jgi:hypothetical protein